MKEGNLKRVIQICDLLEDHRKEIKRIKNMRKVRYARINIYVLENGREIDRDINLDVLGEDILKFILNQKRLYLQSRIIELEAELRNL